MPGIPPPRESDAEDVIWALQTAETQWKRQEREDALVWLRRAVLSAGEAHHDDRMIELARHAVELAERLEHGELVATEEEATDSLLVDDADIESLPPSVPPEELPHASEIPSIPALDLPPDLDEAPEHRPAPSSARAAPASAPAREGSRPGVPRESATPGELHIVSVLSERAPAAESTAPTSPRAARASSAPNPPRPAGSKPPSRQPSNAPTPAPRPSPATAAAPPAPEAPRPTGPPRPGGLPGPKRLTQELVRPAIRPVGAPSNRAAPKGRSQPPRARTAPPTGPPASPSSAEDPTERAGPARLDGRLAPLRPEHATVIQDAEEDEVTPAPFAAESDEDALLDALEAPAAAHPATTEPHTPAHRSHAPTHAPPLELGDVEAFADLPDDARDTFATAASQVHLSAGQEVADFALAYIVAGEVDVAPRDIPVIATHLATGAVLRAQGTPTDAPPLRLVCTTKSAHIAVWSDEAVLAAFRSCPWVEDDLRSAADPVQALVGMSMGALGRRLDDMLRAQVGALLKVRSLLEGEIVAEAGAPVPGLVVVGAGRLELFDHDAVVGELLPGEFLFADQVLGAGAAPYGARAGAGGALVLAGNRAVAQELMVTCPPLLEILAGM